MSMMVKTSTCAFSSLQPLFCSISPCSKVSEGHVSCAGGAGELENPIQSWSLGIPTQLEPHCGSQAESEPQDAACYFSCHHPQFKPPSLWLFPGKNVLHRQLCLFHGRPRVSLPTPSSSIIREPSPSRGHRLWKPGMVGQQRDPRSEEERALQREAMRMERSSTNPGEGSQSPLWGVTREAALSNKALPQLSSLRAATFSLGNCFLNGILTQLYHLPATFIYYNSFILVLQSQSCSF